MASKAAAPLALEFAAHGQAQGWRRGEDLIDALPYIDALPPDAKRQVRTCGLRAWGQRMRMHAMLLVHAARPTQQGGHATQLRMCQACSRAAQHTHEDAERGG